jgi:hypothetical protein
MTVSTAGERAMSTNGIVVRQLAPDDLEPELVALVTPIARRWEAAALRVPASHVDPEVNLPTSERAPETILAKRFEQIARVRPDAARRSGLRAVDRLSSPKMRRKLGAGLSLDFSQSASVEQLVKAPDPAPRKG